MLIFVTVPGLKKEPITIPDNATVGDFVREAFNRTGVSLFNGFGFRGQAANGTFTLGYSAPLMSKVNAANAQDQTTNATINFSNANLPAPPAPSTATATTGGTLAAATYNVQVTYVNPTGETVASAVSTQVTTGATSTITVTSPVANGDATGYNVYAGTGTPTKQGATTPIGTNFTFTSVSAGAALPGANTANSPVVASSTLITSLGIANGDELIVFNTPLGG